MLARENSYQDLTLGRKDDVTGEEDDMGTTSVIMGQLNVKISKGNRPSGVRDPVLGHCRLLIS